MNYKIIAALALSIPITAFAYDKDLIISKEANRHPVYMGVETGYGSTTWGYLVPPEENAALTLSTPTSVAEGGAIWGILLGYEFSPHFGIEGSYNHYPNATIKFDETSIFTFDHDDITEFTTKTDCVSLITKFMLYIPNTQIRAVSSVGISNVHRSDILFDSWSLSPTFGLGFNYDLNAHVMVEIGANLTTGYAIAELDPVENFVPFLYSGYLHLNWRF